MSVRCRVWFLAILHPQQRRRYYSCLIDRSCKKAKNSTSAFRLPLYRIELPGYPILSDGKADNQNHALPFSRGTITQCVDANQGAYFEQMLLLPNALGEFRWKAKRMLGRVNASAIVHQAESINECTMGYKA
eukprot:g19164.t1